MPKERRDILLCLAASVFFHLVVFAGVPAGESSTVSKWLVKHAQRTKVEFKKFVQIIPKPKPEPRRTVRRVVRRYRPQYVVVRRVEPEVPTPPEQREPATPIARILPPRPEAPEAVRVPEDVGTPTPTPSAPAPEPTLHRAVPVTAEKAAPRLAQLPEDTAGPAPIENENPGSATEPKLEPVRIASLPPKGPEPEAKIRVDAERPGGPPGPGGERLLDADPEAPKRVTMTPGPGTKAAPALGSPLSKEPPRPDSAAPSTLAGGGGRPEGPEGAPGPVRIARAEGGGTPGELKMTASPGRPIKPLHGEIALPAGSGGGGGEGMLPGMGGRGSGVAFMVVKAAPGLAGGLGERGTGWGGGGTGGWGGGEGGGVGPGIGPGTGPGGFASPVGTGPGGTGEGEGPIIIAMGIPQGVPGGGQPGMPFILGGGDSPYGTVPGAGEGGWGTGGPGIGMGGVGKGGPGFTYSPGGGLGPGGGGIEWGVPGPGEGGGPGGPGYGPGGPIAVEGGTGSGGPGMAGLIARGMGALGLGPVATKVGNFLAPGGGGVGAGGPGGDRRLLGMGAAKGTGGGLWVGISGSFDMPLGVTTADYDADASGMTNLLATVRERTNIHVTAQERFVPLEYDNIKNTPILHIRGHKPFSFTPEEREALQKYVANGGMIFGEDSHGPFGECFRREMKRIFGDGLEKLPQDHDLYRAHYVFDRIPEGDMGERYGLEGIQVGDRLGVVFSRNDYGDSWEGTGDWVQGRNRESAFQMGVNIYTYAVAKWRK